MANPTEPPVESFLPARDQAPIDPDLAAEQIAQLSGLETSDTLAARPAPAPIGKGWAFDWGQQRFVRSGATSLPTRGLSTLIHWIDKALRTARGAHPIYTSAYGMERPFDLIGRPLGDLDLAEYQERVRDALTFHPRIADVTQFSAELDADSEEVQLSYTVVLDDSTLLRITGQPMP